MIFNELHARAAYRYVTGGTQNSVLEMRVLFHGKNGNCGGFFNNEEDFIGACRLHAGSNNIYIGLQARPTKMFKLSPNKLCYLKKTTRADDIEVVRSFLIDVDPIRPKDCAATDSELAEAKIIADAILTWSYKQQYQRPLVAMSGNGYHLIYSLVSLVLTPVNRDEIETKIKIFEANMQNMFSSDKIKIDKISDFPRIIRLPGTLNMKGESTNERPHRLSQIIVDGEGVGGLDASR